MIFNPAAGTAGGGLPEFEYTGQFQLIDEGRKNGVRNWRIRFLTSGVLTFSKLRNGGIRRSCLDGSCGTEGKSGRKEG